MESNKQTELISKIETNIDRQQAESPGGWGLGDGGIEQKGERTPGQPCGDCVGEGSIRGIIGNGKKQ